MGEDGPGVYYGRTMVRCSAIRGRLGKGRPAFCTSFATFK